MPDDEPDDPDEDDGARSQPPAPRDSSSIDPTKEPEPRFPDLFDTPALRAMRKQEERWRDIFDTPALRAMRKQEERWRDIFDPPALRAMREQEERWRDIHDPPALRAMREQEERWRDIHDPPFMKAMREQEERLRSILDPPALKAMREQEERFRDVLDPPFMKAMREQQERLSGLAGSVQALTTFGQSAELFGRGASVLVSALRASRLDTFAEQSALAAVGVSKLAAEVTDPAFQPVQDVLDAGVGLLEAPLDEAPARLAGAVSAEVFRALDLDTSLRGASPDVAKDERDVLLVRTSDELELTVRNADPELVSLLAGARHASRSDNPDKVRHVCISLRELLGHVLRRLAPDAAIREWTTDPAHFHNGSPTRKARLGFLYRAIGMDALRDLVDADIRATLKLIDALSEGSHVISLNANPAALLLLMTRAEGTLLLLLRLEAHRKAERT